NSPRARASTLQRELAAARRHDGRLVHQTPSMPDIICGLPGAALTTQPELGERRAMNRHTLCVCLLVAAGVSTLSGRDRDTRITVAPGVQLFVHEEGRGQPVIVLHGGPGLDSNYLAPDFAPLARHHRLVFYDQRGSGRSTRASGVTADVL